MTRVSAACPLLLALTVAMTACAPVADGPSLSRRPAEAIDPRIPVVDRSAALPADPALAAALRQIAQPVLDSAGAIDAAIARAAQLAAQAGPSGSESWISAQQALSAAIAAQERSTRAIGAFDQAVAERIRSGARLVPQDLVAVRAIADDLARIDARQRAALAAVRVRLQR